MIDATRSETDQEIINAYWRGYTDACKKMEKINENIKELTTVLRVAEKTFGVEMSQVKAEDVPDIIASILEKMAKRKAKVEGNGITEDIKVENYQG
jgi:predicted regulator of amino acid metabolism with ACT domain